MAKQYGFQYELVQYKWPRWLHQQTEKQRIIWGYKILFLDVLFPLAVDKILFVDADQVRSVRSLRLQEETMHVFIAVLAFLKHKTSGVLWWPGAKNDPRALLSHVMLRYFIYCIRCSDYNA